MSENEERPHQHGDESQHSHEIPSDLKPLEPHQYPASIIVSAVVLLGMSAMALFAFPTDLAAARDLRRGENLTGANRHLGAVKYFNKVLERKPSSKKARLAIAISLFSLGSDAADQLALMYISNMRLDKYDWRKVCEVMPQKYQSQFSQTEE